jgi:hypothetical protein
VKERANKLAALVDLALQTLHDGDGSEVPATADDLTRFMRSADERIGDELVTVDDVRCGLLRLREAKQVLAIACSDGATRYALRRHLVAKRRLAR